MAKPTKLVLATALCATAIAWLVVTRDDEPAAAPAREAMATRAASPPAEPALPEPAPESLQRATAPAPVAPPTPTVAAGVQLPAPPWIVAGLLLDTTARPIADVSVVFEAFGQESAHARATSRADGSFELALPAVAGGHVSVDDPEWTAIYRPVLWGQRDVGERELTVVAARCAPISGQVFDDFGQPISEVSISVGGILPPRADFARSLEQAVSGEWRASSDQQGHFAIERAPILPQMHIFAQRSGYHPFNEELTERVRLRIVLRGGEVLVGHVVDELGRPVEAAVFCHPAGTMSDATGRFALDISGVNSRSLVAVCAGHLPGRLECVEPEPNLVASWPYPVVLRLGGTPLTIRGRVIAADGRPLTSLQVRIADPECLRPGDDFSCIEFLARVNARVTAEGAEFSESQADESAAGEFEVRGLQNRMYRLLVEDRESLLATTTGPIQAGRTDVIVTLPADAIWPEVAGTVVDRRGDPVPGAAVYFECAPDASGAVRRTDPLTTDEQGRFARGPLLRAAATAHVQAPGMAVPTRTDISTSADAEHLTLTTPVRTRVRIEALQTGDSAAFFDRAGNPVSVTVTQGNMAFGSQVIGLTSGKSEVVTVPDDALTLVLMHTGSEVARLAVDLRPGEVQVLRP